jgi:hypothetical protein
MIDTKTVNRIKRAPVSERLHLIELLLKSLKEEITTKPRAKHKRFKIRKFNLGQEVHLDRDELYSERS